MGMIIEQIVIYPQKIGVFIISMAMTQDPKFDWRYQSHI